MKKEKISIAIIEDHQDIIDYLTDAFNETTDFSCTNQYKNAEEAMIFLPKSDVKIVVVDIGLPGKSGIECVRQIKALRPDIEFMMYTVFDQNDNIFESLKAGASGYLLKSDNEEKVIKAVRELLNGGAPMSPGIARKVRNFFFSDQNKAFKKMELLSNRQSQILDLLSKGLRYKEIASQLNITQGTVKQHIHKIYQKLHVQNKTEAINKYLEREV